MPPVSDKPGYPEHVAEHFRRFPLPKPTHVPPALRGPGFYITSEMANGALPPERAAQLAAANGYRTLAIALTEPENFPLVTEIREACAEWGLTLATWDMTRDLETFKRQFETWRPESHHMDIEGLYFPSFAEQDDWVRSVRAYVGKDYPLAVCTNFGGIETPERAAVYHECGIPIMPFSYPMEPGQENSWPAAVDDYARRVLGFPYSIPIVGDYHGFALQNFENRLLTAEGHPAFGVWVYTEGTTTAEGFKVRWRLAPA